MKNVLNIGLVRSYNTMIVNDGRMPFRTGSYQTNPNDEHMAKCVDIVHGLFQTHVADHGCHRSLVFVEKQSDVPAGTTPAPHYEQTLRGVAAHAVQSPGVDLVDNEDSLIYALATNQYDACYIHASNMLPIPNVLSVARACQSDMVAFVVTSGLRELAGSDWADDTLLVTFASVSGNVCMLHGIDGDMNTLIACRVEDGTLTVNAVQRQKLAPGVFALEIADGGSVLLNLRNIHKIEFLENVRVGGTAYDVAVVDGERLFLQEGTLSAVRAGIASAMAYQ